MEKRYYDVVIVGAGPAGIMCAYELTENDPSLSIAIIDKGNDIYHRECPILKKKITKCPSRKNKSEYEGCFPTCAIIGGFGGAGAYSDGKFTITTEYGGMLPDHLGEEKTLELIKYVDGINLKFGAPLEITNPNTPKIREIERRGLAVGLKILRSEIRHLGTEVNLNILKGIYEYLKDKIVMFFKSEVTDITLSENDETLKKIVIDKDQTVYAKNVVVAPGRDGSSWLAGKISAQFDIPLTTNGVDIGVRVETNNEIMQEINENLYEGKFIYKTKEGPLVRTFCSNPSGHVVVENNSGIMLANGHAFTDPAMGSKNTNFALLVSHHFTQPFNRPDEYARSICKLANMLSNGSVIVQRYGDLKDMRRSTEKRIAEGFVKPTLKEAIPGDLSLVLPHKTLNAIQEMLEALDKITPGIASEHTLLYGVEAKFYSSRPEVDKNFETKIKGLYFAGDGAGLTRGLAQASANGVAVARNILIKQKEK